MKNLRKTQDGILFLQEILVHFRNYFHSVYPNACKTIGTIFEKILQYRICLRKSSKFGVCSGFLEFLPMILANITMSYKIIYKKPDGTLTRIEESGVVHSTYIYYDNYAIWILFHYNIIVIIRVRILRQIKTHFLHL